METAGYVCMVDEGNKLIVWSALKVSVSLTEIDVDLDGVLDRRHREFSVPEQSKGKMSGVVRYNSELELADIHNPSPTLLHSYHTRCTRSVMAPMLVIDPALPKPPW